MQKQAGTGTGKDVGIIFSAAVLLQNVIASVAHMQLSVQQSQQMLSAPHATALRIIISCCVLASEASHHASDTQQLSLLVFQVEQLCCLCPLKLHHNTSMCIATLAPHHASCCPDKRQVGLQLSATSLLLSLRRLHSTPYILGFHIMWLAGLQLRLVSLPLVWN